MEEHEFRRLLDQFPIVRSKNYCMTEWQDARSEIDKKNEPREFVDEEPFWQKLSSAVEEKVGRAQADKFCKAFQTVHKQFVYEKLNLDVVRKFIGAEGNS